MEEQKFVQKGTFSIFVLLPLFIVSLVLLAFYGAKDPVSGPVFIFISLILLICLLTFYKMTIYIDDTHLSFSMGIGLISKKYSLNDIVSSSPVKNSPFNGIGIRLIMNGWLYSVSGPVFIFISLILLICLLTFYKMTIYIDDTHLSFSMGIGLISKKYSLNDIVSSSPVKNSPFNGIGIRLIMNGWLYSVSGMKAVEIEFRNRKSRVRIGTDRPVEVSEAINRRIGEVNTIPSELTSGHHSYVWLLVIITSLAIIFPVIMILAGSRDSEVKISNGFLNVKGMFSLNLSMGEIREVDTISSLPGIRLRTNGYALGRVLKGSFQMQDKSKARLFVTLKNPPYILIRTGNQTIYLNSKDRMKTIDLFKSIRKELNH